MVVSPVALAMIHRERQPETRGLKKVWKVRISWIEQDTSARQRCSFAQRKLYYMTCSHHVAVRKRDEFGAPTRILTDVKRYVAKPRMATLELVGKFQALLGRQIIFIEDRMCVPVGFR